MHILMDGIFDFLDMDTDSNFWFASLQHREKKSPPRTIQSDTFCGNEENIWCLYERKA